MAIATGALGLGLLSAVVAIAEPFLLRPLPYSNPRELAVLQASAPDLPLGTSIPTVEEWRRQTHLFSSLAAHDAGRIEHVRLTDRTVELLTWRVSPEFFHVLGISAPDLVPAGAEVPANQVVVTPQGRRLAGTGVLSVIDASAGVVDRWLTVVGALPDDFVFPDPGIGRRAGVLIPFRPQGVVAADGARPGSRALSGRPGPQLLARLRPGVTPTMVVQSLSRLPSGSLLNLRAEWLADRMASQVRGLLLGMLTAGLLVLVVCTGNLTTFFVIRTIGRSREFFTRQALGASRFQITRLWLVDLTVLIALSTAAGLWLADVALGLARGYLPDALLLLGTPSVTWRVVGWGAAAALAMAAVCALTTGLAMRSVPTNRVAIAPRARRATGGRLVGAVIQTGLATVLIIGGTLLGRSYLTLISQDVGYDTQATTIGVRYVLPTTQAASSTVEAVYATVHRLQALPGVMAAAATPGPLVNSVRAGRGIRVDGVQRLVDTTAVTPAFFEATGLTILQGRGFTQEDDQAGGSVVVNDLFAQHYWPMGGAVGRTVQLGGRDLSVIGVVRRAHDFRLDELPGPMLYHLIERDFRTSQIVYVLRTVTRSAPNIDSVYRAVAAARPDAVVQSIESLESRLAGTIRDRAFATLGLITFGLVTLGVAGAGIVAVVAFSAQQRTREIAVRTALGAQRGDLLRLIAREAITAALTGAVAGVVAGRLLSGVLKGLVYGVQPGDWPTMLAGASLIAVIMVAAALVAARPSVCTPPGGVLRGE